MSHLIRTLTIADYGIGISPNEPNPEKAVEELVSFLGGLCGGLLGHQGGPPYPRLVAADRLGPIWLDAFRQKGGSAF